MALSMGESPLGQPRRDLAQAGQTAPACGEALGMAVQRVCELTASLPGQVLFRMLNLRLI